MINMLQRGTYRLFNSNIPIILPYISRENTIYWIKEDHVKKPRSLS